jgi:fibronectin type III domain protein/parallel beta helix pectate lyase-like protein/glycosyl hydrolase family 141
MSRRPSLLRALVVFALVAASGTVVGLAYGATGTTVVVSPSGDDTAPGTPAQPVRSLSRARDLARAATHPVTVQLLDGTYRLSSPLVLDARDSGVTWSAASGAHPVVSGGVKVGGWALTDAARGLWSASLSVNTRQLYVNGVRAQRARGRVPVALKATATGYTAASPVMSTWRNPSDVEFVYTGGDGLWSTWYGLGPWTEARCPVGAISGTTVTMAQPCWDNSTKRPVDPNHTSRSLGEVGPADLHAGRQPAYVENAFELLDQPGEWYLDRAARRVYYLPRPGEDLTRADVEAPRLESLVSGANLHDVTFSGITFGYATWLRPGTGEGLSEVQATLSLTGSGAYARQGLCGQVSGGTCPFGDWTKAPGNVSFNHASGIRFTGDAFVHLGAAGLDLGDGTQNALVQGCQFTDISGNGAQLGGVDVAQTTASGELTRRNTIQDNHFSAVAVEYHGGVGIFVGYAQDSLIAHNQIDHVAHSGISLGWGGWLDKVGKPAQPNYSRGNTVTDNLIFDHMLVLSDGAGVYTNGITGSSLASGEHITGNVIHDQAGPGNAIYTDNGAAYLTITDNVLYHNFHSWAGRHTNTTAGDGSYDPEDVEHNWWEGGDPASSAKQVTLAHNQLITGPADAPSSIVDSAGLEPAYRSLATVPAHVPAAPDLVSAKAGNGFAYVAWTRPVDEGGAVTTYTVTSSGGQRVTVSAADADRLGYAKVTGLTNGTAYTFTVAGTNASGSGGVSLPSSPVTPSAAVVTRPGAPTGLHLTPGDHSAAVFFKPPADTGGSPVIAYRVSVSTGASMTVTGRLVLLGKEAFAVFGGLTDGTAYTFTVVAVTAAGTGASATSGTVVPQPV